MEKEINDVEYCEQSKYHYHTGYESFPINDKLTLYIKENTTGVPVYKVKQNKTDIDFTQNYNDIISNV